VSDSVGESASCCDVEQLTYNKPPSYKKTDIRSVKLEFVVAFSVVI